VLRHHVRAVVTEHRCLPTQVIDHLTQNRLVAERERPFRPIRYMKSR
jgi:hypothetical protein